MQKREPYFVHVSSTVGVQRHTWNVFFSIMIHESLQQRLKQLRNNKGGRVPLTCTKRGFAKSAFVKTMHLLFPGGNMFLINVSFDEEIGTYRQNGNDRDSVENK